LMTRSPKLLAIKDKAKNNFPEQCDGYR